MAANNPTVPQAPAPGAPYPPQAAPAPDGGPANPPPPQPQPAPANVPAPKPALATPGSVTQAALQTPVALSTITALVPDAFTGKESAEAAKVTGYFFQIVESIAALLTTIGVMYPTNLPREIEIIIGLLVAGIFFILPWLQANVTRGKVYSPDTVAKMLLSLEQPKK